MVFIRYSILLILLCSFQAAQAKAKVEEADLKKVKNEEAKVRMMHFLVTWFVRSIFC